MHECLALLPAKLLLNQAMNTQLIKASPAHKDVINQLMQFYIYDFSEYLPLDVEDNGRFADYPYLENYWKEEGKKFPYMILKDGKYVGFVLVRLIEAEPHNYFSVAEFFVMKKYRREGVGKTIAKEIFNLHRGNWEVYQKESNKPAQFFWNKVIDEYTVGQFTEHWEDEKRIQHFKN